MILVVMGVAGSGKTTIGTRLADALGCAYLEGDSLHPAASIEKMSRGIPLTDADREPWLRAIRTRILDAYRAGSDLVVTCSALTRSYRAMLEQEGSASPADIACIGDEDAVREQIRGFADIGITDLVVAANGTEDEVRRTVELTGAIAREGSS